MVVCRAVLCTNTHSTMVVCRAVLCTNTHSTMSVCCVLCCAVHKHTHSEPAVLQYIKHGASLCSPLLALPSSVEFRVLLPVSCSHTLCTCVCCLLQTLCCVNPVWRSRYWWCRLCRCWVCCVNPVWRSRCWGCRPYRCWVVQTIFVRTVLVLCKFCLEVKMLVVQTVQMLGGGDDICADAVGAVQTLFGGQDVGGADDTCADGVGAGPFWWCNFNIGDADPICRVGQDPICTPYMTVCMVISLLKISYIHRTYVCPYGFGQPNLFGNTDPVWCICNCCACQYRKSLLQLGQVLFSTPFFTCYCPHQFSRAVVHTIFHVLLSTPIFTCYCPHHFSRAVCPYHFA